VLNADLTPSASRWSFEFASGEDEEEPTSGGRREGEYASARRGRFSCVTGMFETAVRSRARSPRVSKLALNPGSSQQGRSAAHWPVRGGRDEPRPPHPSVVDRRKAAAECVDPAVKSMARHAAWGSAAEGERPVCAAASSSPQRLGRPRIEPGRSIVIATAFTMHAVGRFRDLDVIASERDRRR